MSKKNIFYETKKLGIISSAMGVEILALSNQEYNLHTLIKDIPSNEENRKVIKELTEIGVQLKTCFEKLEENRQSVEGAYDKIIITLIDG